MKYFLIFFLIFAEQGFAYDQRETDTCKKDCKIGHPNCFSLGPAFEPATLLLQRIVLLTEETPGSESAICEGQIATHLNEALISEGDTCSMEATSVGSTSSILDQLSGSVMYGDSLENTVKFAAGKSPLWDSGLPEFPHLSGEVEFISRSKNLIIFGLREENSQKCLGFFVQ